MFLKSLAVLIMTTNAARSVICPMFAMQAISELIPTCSEDLKTFRTKPSAEEL